MNDPQPGPTVPPDEGRVSKILEIKAQVLKSIAMESSRLYAVLGACLGHVGSTVP